MLNTNQVVVIDFEGFRHKKSGFIIKELSVQSENFSDTLLFGPPKNFSELSSSELKSHNWVSKFLHGIEWTSGEYPYTYLETYFIFLTLRFQSGFFYAKGTEKCHKIAELLKRPVQNLEELNCPKIETLAIAYTSSCGFHSSKTPQRQRSRHCAKRKASAFLQWVEQRNETVISSDQLISKFDHLQLYDSRSQTLGKII